MAFGLIVGMTTAGADPNDGSGGSERPLIRMAPNSSAPAKSGATLRMRRAGMLRTPSAPTAAAEAASPPRVMVPVV